MAAPMMTAQIFLVTPSAPDADALPGVLARVLTAAPAAACLLRRSGLSASEYEALVRACVGPIQAAGCAALVDNDIALARAAGADGVHVDGSLAALEAALKALKPDLIVGTTAGADRHEAMLRGESGADYLFFGDPDTALSPETAEFAAWWAETFEVPAVLCDAQATPESLAAHGCEFIAPGEALWQAPDPATALAAFAAALEGEHA